MPYTPNEARWLPLTTAIDRQTRGGHRLTLAIDGRSTAGKTTLAEWLRERYGCNVFHMDDFFLRPEQRTAARYQEPGGNVDRERFLKEVLLPLKAGEAVSYRPFNCVKMALEPALTVQPALLTVVEGAYSLHPDLAGFYGCTVFLDIASDLQRRRILQREDPEKARVFLEKWVPLEEAYFARYAPMERCDFVFTAADESLILPARTP